jgi:hypothetical protein
MSFLTLSCLWRSGVLTLQSFDPMLLVGGDGARERQAGVEALMG